MQCGRVAEPDARAPSRRSRLAGAHAPTVAQRSLRRPGRQPAGAERQRTIGSADTAQAPVRRAAPAPTLQGAVQHAGAVRAQTDGAIDRRVRLLGDGQSVVHDGVGPVQVRSADRDAGRRTQETGPRHRHLDDPRWMLDHRPPAGGGQPAHPGSRTGPQSDRPDGGARRRADSGSPEHPRMHDVPLAHRAPMSDLVVREPGIECLGAADQTVLGPHHRPCLRRSFHRPRVARRADRRRRRLINLWTTSTVWMNGSSRGAKPVPEPEVFTQPQLIGISASTIFLVRRSQNREGCWLGRELVLGRARAEDLGSPEPPRPQSGIPLSAPGPNVGIRRRQHIHSSETLRPR